MKQQEQTPEFAQAVAENADRWVPACGGHEEPVTYSGTRYLWCFNPMRHSHAHINLDTDMEEVPVFMK